jgi:F-type H+-transporting ATPase subunit alpha
MKLDYLQFLELEVFTRFGARLESSMADSIARGQILREILKQDRLAPLPEVFEMAWLVAFNDGLFSGIPLHKVSALLNTLQHEVEHSSLTLDSPRQAWSLAVAGWLQPPDQAQQS